MAAAIPFIIAASAGVAAIGAIQQGRAAKAASEFNAHVARENAAISREEAALFARQQDRETYLRMGAIRAAQGKSGGAMEGSVLDILGDTAAQSELEKQHILYQGELKARGFQNTATLDTFSGQQAQRSSRYRAGAELLGGAADAYGARARLSRTG